MSRETPHLRWLEPMRSKCDRCGKRADGIRRGVQNESYGPHCERCANKRLKDSEAVRARKEPTT